MKLQKGRFLIKNIEELENIPLDKNGMKKIIYLTNIGQFEYGENNVPTSRLFIEYHMNNYSFYPTQIFNKTGQQMYIYANNDMINSELAKNPNFLSRLAKYNIDRDTSLQEYINRNPNECFYDFWWNIERDYFIIFGEENKLIIENYINECFKYDGGNEEIKRKLLTLGYKL